MLTDEQLREHDKELNHVNDVLTTVMSSVRQAYPAEDRANSIIKDALDVINSVQQLRAELRNLELPNPEPKPTDTDALFDQLEVRILSLEGTQQTSNRKDGRRGYKVPGKMSQRFISMDKKQRHVSLDIYIPFDKINDPKGKCHKRESRPWSYVKLSSVADLDYIMGLVEQAYIFNLAK